MEEIKLTNTFVLLQEKLNSWYEVAIKGIPNIIVALVVICVFILLAKTIKETVKKILDRFTKTNSVNQLFSTLAHLTVLLIGLFTALEILGLEKAVTSLLAGAGVIGLALGFAFQEIASNFVSGILIAFQEPYKIGDIVEVDGTVGEVTRIELRTTCLTTYQGLEVFIPNKDMFTKAIINYTSTPRRRVDLDVGVTYDADLRKVESVVKEALEMTPDRISYMPVEVFFHEFGDSSINLSARVWVEYASGVAFFRARHAVVMNIKQKFDDNNITIPFPIRTLDFSNKLELQEGA
ncbi:MAG: mechanosensitive ion channel protein MscS [Halobacteriovoraceae bacterium]|nr:mechanosensitive ion channel protein MscS [Halobacteriovoraceae bacterium]|tara:strand:- start:5056 stop:5934 length:879 start_codon:yes stop_codon:yes gene_type:complete